jgi:hypothetical protein
MNENNTISPQVIEDFVAVLKARGVPDETIKEILFKVVAQVEVEVHQALYNKLSDEKRQQLQEMLDAKKTGQEIAMALGITEAEMDALETQKFAEVLQQLLPSIEENDQQ